MRQKEKLFTPLGVDHITFACYDRHFWQRVLGRFGFETVNPDHGHLAMAHGDVRIVIKDPEMGPYIADFVAQHGDMQVFSVAILVDDSRGAREELRLRNLSAALPRFIFEDMFGEAARVPVSLSFPSTVRWELLERISKLPNHSSSVSWKSRGVDHFAIGVNNLEQWEAFYHSLGFETIYAPPHDKIRGQHSGMKTVAVQRGDWVVALVEGVDIKLPSQVTNYVRAHGDHAIQHAAIRFDDLPAAIVELMGRGAHFRLRGEKSRMERLLQDPTIQPALEDVMHQGRDHSGSLLQCFTKPLARRPDPVNPGTLKGGFFFELIQRITTGEKTYEERKGFDNKTVKGLYESIEDEELADDTSLLFPDELMAGYRFSDWLARHTQ